MRPIQTFTTYCSILMLISSCIGTNDVSIKLKNPKKKDENVTSLPPVTVSNIQVINHQIIITGTNLASVSQFKVKEGSTNTTLQIESKSANQIVANTLSNVTFAAGKILDFILSNAEAASTFTVNFSLCDSTLGGKGFNCLITPNDKEVLSFDAASGKWKPRAVNGLSYQGAWDANDPQPTTTTAGDYFIVSVANGPYSVGDWIVFNGASFDHINNSSAITTVFGRTGVVTANEGDYSIDKMSDVDTTTAPPLTGDVLKYNGTRWVPGAVSAGSGGTVTNVTATSPISITNGSSTPAISIAQANNTTSGYLTTADWNTFNNKQPAIAVGTTAQYYRGDKTWHTLDTSVVPENTNLYFTNARSLGVPLTGFSTATGAVVATDTVLAAFGKLQGQLNLKSDAAGFVDWSTAGVATLEPTRLNLTTADRAVVTSATGSPVASAVTTTELGYVSGVTSSIQTQLNAKQATISKATVQDVSKLRIYGANTTNYVELSATTLTGNRVLTFPDSNGANGNVLTTDGSGNLSWTAPASGGAPTGSAGGDLAGTYPNPTIAANAITDSHIANGAIAQAKINGLTTALAGKEPTITAGTTSQYLRGDKSLGTFASDVLATLLSGLSTATNAVIASTDSVLVAFGKLQAQISGHSTSIAAKADQTNVAQTITAATVTGLTAPVAGADATNKTYVDAQVAGASNQWTETSGSVYRASGNVGIGVSPTAKLDVNGETLFRGISAPAVSSAGNGTIYFDSATNKFKASSNGAAYMDLIGTPSFPLLGPIQNAGAPTYSFSGDTDTGMFSTAADQLAFTTGGTQRFRIQGNSFYLGSMGSSTTSSPPYWGFDSRYSGPGSASGSGRFNITVDHSPNSAGSVNYPGVGTTHTFGGAISQTGTNGGTSSVFNVSNSGGYSGIGYGVLAGINITSGAATISGQMIGAWGLVSTNNAASLPTMNNVSAVKGEFKLQGGATGGTTVTLANSIEAVASTSTNDSIATWNGVAVRAPSGAGTITNKYAIVTEAGAGNVGIGVTDPQSKLHVSDNSSSLVLLDGYLSSTAAPGISIRKARGTSAAPTAVLNDDYLGAIGARGYGATGFSPTSRGLIGIKASENWTDSAQGSNIVFETTANTGTTRSEKVRITDAGNLGIGVTNPNAKFEVVAAADDLETWRSSRFSNTGPNGQGISTFHGAGGNIFRSFSTTTNSKPMVFDSTTDTSATASTGGTLGFSFKVLDSEKIRINDVGNVGVGTSTPTYTDTNLTTNNWKVLTVAATPTTAAGAAALTLSNQKATPAAGDRVGAVHFVSPNNNGTQLYAGFINVSLSGSGGANGYGGEMGFYTKADNSASVLQRMVLTNAGYVGINTSSPGVPLEVAGNGSAPIRLRKDTGSTFWQVGPDAANNFIIYNQAGTGVYVSNGATSWTANSDRRIKKNIELIPESLSKLLQISGVTYNYNTDSENEPRRVGVIAQDVQKVLPEAVSIKNGILGVRYQELIPLAINAIKELFVKVTGHDKQIATQSRQIASMEAKFKKLELENDKLRQENSEIKTSLQRIEKLLLKTKK